MPVQRPLARTVEHPDGSVGASWAYDWPWATSVIVNDFDLVGIAGTPSKADAPLIVDANTVLSGPIAATYLQAVAGRDAQVVERLSGVNRDELSEHHTLQVRRVAANGRALEQRCCGAPAPATFPKSRGWCISQTRFRRRQFRGGVRR